LPQPGELRVPGGRLTADSDAGHCHAAAAAAAEAAPHGALRPRSPEPGRLTADSDASHCHAAAAAAAAEAAPHGALRPRSPESPGCGSVLRLGVLPRLGNRNILRVRSFKLTVLVPSEFDAGYSPQSPVTSSPRRSRSRPGRRQLDWDGYLNAGNINSGLTVTRDHRAGPGPLPSQGVESVTRTYVSLVTRTLTVTDSERITHAGPGITRRARVSRTNHVHCHFKFKLTWPCGTDRDSHSLYRVPAAALPVCRLGLALPVPWPLAVFAGH
jgi:hypothetical protein